MFTLVSTSLSSNGEMCRARWHQYIQGVALQKKNPGLSIQHFSRSNSKGYNKMPLNQSLLPAGWTEVRLQVPWHLVASITLHKKLFRIRRWVSLAVWHPQKEHTQGSQGPWWTASLPPVGSWWSLFEGQWQKWNFHSRLSSDLHVYKQDPQLSRLDSWNLFHSLLIKALIPGMGR